MFPPSRRDVRVSVFESNMRAARDEISLRDAEKSGRAALDALEGFEPVKAQQS